MTANQINFAKLVEENRHNKMMEQETARSNRANESIGYANINESSRHNQEMERTNWFNAQGQSQVYASQARLNESNVGVQREANQIAYRNAMTAEAQTAINAYLAQVEKTKAEVQQIEATTRQGQLKEAQKANELKDQELIYKKFEILDNAQRTAQQLALEAGMNESQIHVNESIWDKNMNDSNASAILANAAAKNADTNSINAGINGINGILNIFGLLNRR